MTPSAVLRQSSAAKAAVRSAARDLRHDLAIAVTLVAIPFCFGAWLGLIVLGFCAVSGC